MLEKRIHWTEIRPRAGYNFAGLYEWILYEVLAGRPIVWIPLMFQTASGCRVTVCGREGRLTAQFDLDLNWYSRSTRRVNPKLRGHLQFQSARSARWVSLVGSEDAFCCWGEHHLILPYPILWRASVSPCPSAPPGFCFAVLFLSRWHISVWIISLLQEAAAPTIFMCVCARLPGRAHARAASFLPVFSPPGVCEALSKRGLRWKGARRRGVTEGRVDAWEWWMKGSLLGCEEMWRGLFCCPWKNHSEFSVVQAGDVFAVSGRIASVASTHWFLHTSARPSLPPIDVPPCLHERDYSVRRSFQCLFTN